RSIFALNGAILRRLRTHVLSWRPLRATSANVSLAAASPRIRPGLSRVQGNLGSVAGMMNPGKVVDPFPITSNLRMGPLFRPPQIRGHFVYPEDGSFTRAMTRCVGVGACRRHDSTKGIMCPSYMATREEKHSTRGRARLLFEMLNGDPIDNLWRSEAVEEALDLCLGCKGCKHDCPVHVDMATYKAEFRAHHYKGRLRPRVAYSMGLLWEWSRLAASTPRLVNALLQAPGLSSVLKWGAGIAPQRRLPPYAPETFVKWSRRRRAPLTSKRVVLWPDTFNNYFRTTDGD